MSEMQDDNGIHMAGAKRTKRTYTPRQVEDKQAVSGGPVMLPMRLLIGGATVKDNGPITGKEYTFQPGQITYVDQRDFEGLLARRTNPKRCCGGKSPAAAQPLYGVA